MKKIIKDMPHNGKLLEKHINEHNTNKAWLARQMGVTPSSVNAYFASDTLQTGIWWRASQALQHNFLAEIAEALNIEYIGKKETELLQKADELQQKINAMQQELDELKMKVKVYEGVLKK